MNLVESLSKNVRTYWNEGKIEKVIIIFLGILLWPLTLTVLILKQKWNIKLKLILIAIIIIICLNGYISYLLNSTSSPAEKSITPTPTPNQGDCIGPDGKHIDLDPINCQKFNDAWKNQKQNQQVTSPVATSTVTPTLIPTAKPAQIKQTDNKNTLPISNEAVSQKNAVAKAKSYLSFTAFSHDGLVDQLEYEQFSHEDAVYGADNSGANWDEQAAKKAKAYMEYSAFSRGSLIDQLKYDKFTQEQAEYGANAVGL